MTLMKPVFRSSALLWFSLLSACSALHAPTEQNATPSHAAISHAGQTLWQSGIQFVAVQSRPAGTPANNQPHAIGADRIRALLGSLRVSKDGQDHAKPVFTPDAVAALSPALAKGLATAGPDQDIAFAVTTRAQSNQHQMLLLDVREPLLTTGLVFYREGRLNLIFGKMHTTFEAHYLNTSQPPPTPAGQRSRRIQNGWQISGDAGFTYPRPGRRDWVSMPISSGTSGNSGNSGASTQSASNHSEQTPEPGTTVDRRYQEIAQRLRVVDKLHAKGLITDQEYRDKRREILKGL